MNTSGARPQLDLFRVTDCDNAAGTDGHGPGSRPRTRRSPDASHLAESLETTAQRLEESGDYQILRRLKPRPVLANWSHDDRRPGQKIAIILDTETTGLDHRQHEIIELGMVMFTYTDDGIQDVVGVFDELREPSEPISSEITRITSITDAMVKGRSIDPDAVADFVAPADIARRSGWDLRDNLDERSGAAAM